MSDFLLVADPLTGGPVESYGPPAEPMVRVPLIGRDKRIMREVAQAHRVSVDDMIGPRKHRVVYQARREAMARIRDELGFSFPKIGRLFNRDHTSVLAACRGIKSINPQAEKGAAMPDVAETKLAHELDTAVADYQRHFGRERTIEKLAHMLASRQAAQRILDEAKAGAGEPLPRAAE